jgi:hypothetical protein
MTPLAPASGTLARSAGNAAALAGFFLLVPLLLGVLLGASRAGVALHFSWPMGIAFWSIASVSAWALLFAGTWVAASLLRPWHPPLWLILAVGAVLGSLPARYAVYLTAVALGDFMLNGRVPQPIPALQLSWEFMQYYLQVWTGIWIIWIAVGLVYQRWFSVPRYAGGVDVGREASVPASAAGAAQGAAQFVPQAASPTAAAAAPISSDQVAANPLLDRLPAKIGRNVLALEAEDHYVKVHTDQGSTLLLYRLSDAINDLGIPDGIRVHRSFWVRKSAVSRVAPNGKGMLLTLSNGLEVPVSQAYKELARQAGLEP